MEGRVSLAGGGARGKYTNRGDSVMECKYIFCLLGCF